MLETNDKKKFIINTNILHIVGIQNKLIELKTQSMEIVSISWKKQVFHGNNQQILLEQLEQVGINVPYSCRIGICGCCQIKIIEGAVSVLKKSAIVSHGLILSCSCIPKASLKLSP